MMNGSLKMQRHSSEAAIPLSSNCLLATRCGNNGYRAGCFFVLRIPPARLEVPESLSFAQEKGISYYTRSANHRLSR
jgi:hypothetical protein